VGSTKQRLVEVRNLSSKEELLEVKKLLFDEQADEDPKTGRIIIGQQRVSRSFAIFVRGLQIHCYIPPFTRKRKRVAQEYHRPKVMRSHKNNMFRTRRIKKNKMTVLKKETRKNKKYRIWELKLVTLLARDTEKRQ